MINMVENVKGLIAGGIWGAACSVINGMTVYAAGFQDEPLPEYTTLFKIALFPGWVPYYIVRTKYEDVDSALYSNIMFDIILYAPPIIGAIIGYIIESFLANR